MFKPRTKVEKKCWTPKNSTGEKWEDCMNKNPLTVDYVSGSFCLFVFFFLSFCLFVFYLFVFLPFWEPTHSGLCKWKLLPFCLFVLLSFCHSESSLIVDYVSGWFCLFVLSSFIFLSFYLFFVILRTHSQSTNSLTTKGMHRAARAAKNCQNYVYFGQIALS